MVERNLLNGLDHSACGVGALACNDWDRLGLLHVDDIILIFGLPVVFSGLVLRGHGLLDSDLVRDVLLDLDFARDLHSLADHPGHGYLLGDGAHSVFGGSGARARVGGKGDVSATAVDSGCRGSYDSDLASHSFVLRLLHLLDFPLHLIFLDDLHTVPNRLLILIGGLGPHHWSLLLDLFLSDLPLWHVDRLSLPCGDIVALECEHLCRCGVPVLGLGVALSRLAATAGGRGRLDCGLTSRDGGLGHGAAAAVVLLGQLGLGGLVLIDLPAGGLGLSHGEHSSNCNGLWGKLGWWEIGTYAFHDQI